VRALLLLVAVAGCRTPLDGAGAGRLGAVRSWAIQLQGLEREGAVDRLDAADADLLVVDAVRTVRGLEGFDTKGMVARLRARKVVLAYVNVGQAEEYRAYWDASWRAPSADARGSPDYLLTIDPDGWAGNYPVAFWDPRWQARLWGAADALVDRAIADGFDGVFLDWVLGWAEPSVAAAAREAGVDGTRAMARLVRDLGAYARARRPGFAVVALNAAGLAAREPDLLRHVDGVCQESVTFGGGAGAAWDDPAAGDAPPPADAEVLLADLDRVRAAGVPVFTLDYALDPANAALARERSRGRGFVPFVSRAPLDRLP
jgi:cysteinyl-tRNA synthetase